MWLGIETMVSAMPTTDWGKLRQILISTKVAFYLYVEEVAEQKRVRLAPEEYWTNATRWEKATGWLNSNCYVLHQGKWYANEKDASVIKEGDQI